MSTAAIPAITGAVGLVSQIGAQKSAQSSANKALKGQQAITDRQTQAYDQLLPFLQSLQGNASGLVGKIGDAGSQAFTNASTYDPARDSDAAISAYDSAAKESLNRDITGATMPVSMRGFLGQNSENTGQVRNILGKRAADRAGFVGGLRSTEFQRKQQALTQGQGALMNAFQTIDPSARNATGMLNAPSASYQGQSQMYTDRANSMDPSANIGMLGSSIKQWMKRSK